MPFDSDIALIGTGVAPLVAASHLLSLGKSILLLNPDSDFFLEDSELPLDPLLHGVKITPARLSAQRVDDSLRVIEPYFPGAIERWPASPSQARGFRDPEAPHIRSRARLWLPMTDELEAPYVESSDLGLNPQILEGVQALVKFPGMAPGRPGNSVARALMVSKLADVDVSRYRNGLLEFMRERLGREGVVCNASSLELTPEGVRFRSQGVASTARLRLGALIFWTPRLSSWILGQAKRQGAKLPMPVGVRLWEQWSILSRDEVDPSVVGIWDGRMAVWADGEGAPGTRQLAVLRAGPLVSLDSLQARREGVSWASSESFDALGALCREFLHWERYTIRGMRPRAIFEWGPGEPDGVASVFDTPTFVVQKSDGPLRDVVEAARRACDRLQL
ncbi:MAG: hypothetical protein P4M08_08115 [Oligoflexia bacterium]|nr:hypothetical protein [Oligoflexia bacterium]